MPGGSNSRLLRAAYVSRVPLACPVCLAHPGVLPVINERAVRYAVTAPGELGLARAEMPRINRRSRAVRARVRMFPLVALFVHVVLLGAAAHALQQPAQTPNPFAGKRLYVDPNSSAQRQAETWRRSKLELPQKPESSNELNSTSRLLLALSFEWPSV